MKPAVGDKAQIHGVVTLCREKHWRRSGVIQATDVTLMRAKNDGLWEVQIPDLGKCIIHESAIEILTRPMEVVPYTGQGVDNPVNIL